MDLIWIPMWIVRESLRESHLDFAWALAWIRYGFCMAPCLDPTCIRTWIFYGSRTYHNIDTMTHESYDMDHMIWTGWYGSDGMNHMV